MVFYCRPVVCHWECRQAISNDHRMGVSHRDTGDPEFLVASLQRIIDNGLQVFDPWLLTDIHRYLCRLKNRLTHIHPDKAIYSFEPYNACGGFHLNEPL